MRKSYGVLRPKTSRDMLRDKMQDETKAFDAAMLQIYHRAKSEAGYTASIFFKMLSERRGIATAKYLINAPTPSDGYTRLYELGRLDLTVEAVVVENKKWHALFTAEELQRARDRLTQYRYSKKDG
jgi:predicted Zn-dependent peptidase